MDPNPKDVTANILADDVAAIVKKLKLEPVYAYGCSSGGLAVLSLGKRYPELVKSIVVHEAALNAEAPLKDSGKIFFESKNSLVPYSEGEISVGDVWAVGNYEGLQALDDDCKQRIKTNAKFWSKYYLNSMQNDIYTERDYKNMPPVHFSVGTWSPSWLVYANIKSAEKGGCPITWMHCSHHPERTCPEVLADYINKTITSHV